MKDFRDTIAQMQLHGMVSPQDRINISIPNAEEVLYNAMTYFLSRQQETYRHIKPYAEVAQWLANNEGKGLLLYGDCGLGKSFLARVVLPAILLKYCAKVVSVYDIHTMNAEIDHILRKAIITLDDIGTEESVNNFGNKRFAFAELIDNAEKNNKIFIITTNLGGKDIIARYGERVMERIISTTKRIEFRGKSFRK